MSRIVWKGPFIDEKIYSNIKKNTVICSRNLIITPNLIGLNFDRVWEGTMSDIYYDPEICRNIMVDVRYILFVIDKYANANHLIDEMTLVTPKKNKKK